MKPESTRPIQFSLHLLIGALIVLVSAPILHSQSTNNGAVDIGPRNPGNAPFNLICPVAGPVKFTPPSTSTPNCIDLDQPPSQSPQPPAAGAGNVVGGGPLAAMWFETINVFEAVASVQGASVVPTEPIVGLGPAFNSNSCVSCHEAPAVGGTSGGSIGIVQSNGTTITYNMPLSFTVNPELAAMEDQGNVFNQNPVFPAEFNPNGPGFLDVPVAGPSLEVRVIPGGGSGGFVVQPGSVAELFTIDGRTDAPGCTLAQFPFSTLPSGSISFRIPTPTFGLGLVEATPDAVLMANSPTSATPSTLGVVTGNFNRSGNDGTITRFGWKAQNKSLMIFAGEASNVEMGVTNELFPNDKTVAAGATCPANTAPAGNQPEDEILPQSFTTVPPAAAVASIISSNSQNNAVFMRMNGAPSQCDAVALLTSDPYGTAGPAQCPAFTSAQVTNGQTLFDNARLGCTQCHSPTLVSGLSQNSSLSNQTFHPYSDFAIHDMGPASNGLADGITQGAATSEFFRTAPLWGIGQRLFFLHDGRAHDLATAIADHCPTPATTSTNESCGSIAVFNSLTKAQQQDILDFLRSL